MGKVKLEAIEERVFTDEELENIESEPIYLHDHEQLRSLTFTRTTGWVTPPMVGGLMTTKRNSEEIKRWNDRIETTRRAKKLRKARKM